MQFGSVAFFKVLIKTVLCIVFFVPLVLCVVFAVLLWNKSTEVTEIQQDNERLEYYAAILSGEREPTVKGFYDIYARSGLSDEELIDYVLHGKDEAVPAANTDSTRQKRRPPSPQKARKPPSLRPPSRRAGTRISTPT